MKISTVEVHPVVAPLARPVRTASGAVTEAPLVLIDLVTTDGVTGRSYLFAFHRRFLPSLVDLVVAFGDLLHGDEVVPFDIARKLRSSAMLIGPVGLVGMAASGLDMAAWDALARAAELPLVTLLGGRPVPIPAYDSLGMFPPSEAAEGVADSVARGFRAVKLKIGLPTLEADVAVVRAARAAIPDDVLLMVDYNQSLSVPDATRRTRALDDEGIAWVEEPVRADDFAGCASVAAAAATPIQIGENFHGIFEMGEAIRSGASDLVMPDPQQIGGVTGWLRATALAEAAGLPMSSHIFPEVSAHLLAVSPTRHWLEYLDVAGAVCETKTEVVGGTVTAPDRPGMGLDWDLDAVRRYEAGL